MHCQYYIYKLNDNLKISHVIYITHIYTNNITINSLKSSLFSIIACIF